MNSDNNATAVGFVLAADEGQAFWFLNTLTINKVGGGDSQGRLSIVDHRVPAGFAPPPHVHRASDEAFLVLDGELDGFCGDQAWRAGERTYQPILELSRRQGLCRGRCRVFRHGLATHFAAFR